MSTSYRLSGGTMLQYHTYHSSDLPVIILIHGITGNHKGFQYIIPDLADYHCIVPDLPGFGDSDLPDTKYWSVDGLATLANEFVASLHLATLPVILGHSMGGLVVSSMVAQQPDLYDESMILISPVPTAVTRFDSRAIGAKLGALQYHVGRVAGAAGERLVKSKTLSRAATRIMVKTSDKKRRSAIYQHHIDNLDYFSDSAFYLAVHNDINRRGSIDYAEKLKHKRILLIAGSDDAVTPLPEMNVFASAVHPEEYVVIPGVGHLIHYEKASEATEAIREFLSRQR